MNDLRVLIIGTGVAGTVAAMAMQKAGLRPTIYEAYEQSAGLDHGVYLTVAVNGLDALRAIDAHDVVLSTGFPSGRINFLSGTGRTLGSMAMGPTLDDGTVTHTLKRSELYHGLYREAVARGIRSCTASGWCQPSSWPAAGCGLTSPTARPPRVICWSVPTACTRSPAR